MSDPLLENLPPVTELTKAQRRVLGVLVEKALTTPEVYPLTLKAATAGCNQKSNRDPVVNYDEDLVERIFDELRELGLAAIVHTESGRTARFRHYVRKRFTVTEPQLAILTELLLRGQQSLGELRTRASRMVPIESLEQLRTELEGLLQQNLIRSDGSLDRRGVEVDHNLYPAHEKQPLRARVSSDDDAPAAAPSRVAAEVPSNQLVELQTLCQTMQAELTQLRQEVADLKDSQSQLESDLQRLRQDLGG